MRLHIFLGTSVLLTSGLLPFAHARVFTPEDLFRLEALAGAVPSPDDRTPAIVRVRAKLAAVMHMRTFMSGRDRSGQFRMGVPPWKDMDRYVRNSPISFVDRVGTPVMIVQGDQDYVPIQQGEEFFTALYRQNKPAIFVRYWGEGHILESPANISDLWRHIYEWLDRYLPQ